MQRAINDRVRRAERAVPRRDYSGVVGWARETGRDIDYAMEEFDHRASVLEWVDGLERGLAERTALEQMQDLYGRVG